jgi:hypothetical protein
VRVLHDVEGERRPVALTRALPVEERMLEDARVDVLDARTQPCAEARFAQRLSIGT